MSAAVPWLAAERDDLATNRILDAASVLFARDGVGAVGMAEIAEAAGCSRATLYRYFPNRHELRVAFVHRAARRLGATIADDLGRTTDPAARLERAVLAALRGVRADPVLAAWFASDAVGATAGLAAASDVIETLAAGFLGDTGDRATREAARWVVRVVVSLLAMPGRDAADERRMVRRFLVPAVVTSGDV